MTKVVFTQAALADLDEILEFTALNYPALVGPLEQRIRAVVARIARWPESGRAVPERAAVRVVPLIRFPFRVFYRIRGDGIEILHIHHSSRELWAE